MIRFGWLSIVLLIGVVQGVVVGASLLARHDNRTANRILAALTFAFALRIIPYVIGFAGFYDAYPWLSFAPFNITFVYGPLIFLYVARITESAMPRRWWVHLIPAVFQFAYDSVIFVQPLAFKNWFDGAIHERWIDPLETALTFVSLAAYLIAAYRQYRAYRAWVESATSNSAKHELLWVRNFLIAFAATVAVAAAFDIVSAFVHRLDYFQYFWLYVWYAALVYYLGMEGWRSAGNAYPQRIDPAQSAPETASPVDWQAAGIAWRARVEASGLWRDPELSLARLAAELGMSPAHQSRLVNQGLSQNFSEAINRIRVAAVSVQLADPADTRDLLTIAFDCGFSSKASFNRSFKAFVGQTPSQFRESREKTRLIS